MNHRFAIALCVTLSLLALVAGTVTAAEPSTKQIGLVIAFPDGSEHLEVVKVPAAATTFDVLRAAKINLVSQTTAYGPAVCSIDNVGCPVENCFCDPTHFFWAYYHLDPGKNTWTAAMEGVGVYDPDDGAVEGFAWSGFENDNYTVQPPVYTFAEIVTKTSRAPAQVPEPATVLLLGAGLAGLAGYIRRVRAR